MQKFTGLTLNFLPTGCRLDTLEKKEYTVVPMVILTEGVHQGSEGPIYYPKDELAKTPAAWNHKPIVVYHPERDGEGVSACTPDVLNSRKIGIMLNTKWVGGKLKSEAWIDAERADEVDERIMMAINEKEPMELSTGVFIDLEEEPGEWKGEEYIGIARNYRPDHLALLPDQVGACSLADGAGLLRNAAQGLGAQGKTLLKALVKAGLLQNEQSYSSIHGMLSTAIREKLNVGTDGPFVWVADVYSNFFIYEKDGKLWRLGYMSNDTGVTLSDETPVEVKRVTDYRTVKDGSVVGNQHPAKQKDTGMKLKEKVDGIIAANAGWTETDRKLLMACTEEQIDSMIALNKHCPGATFEGFKLEDQDGKVVMMKRAVEPAKEKKEDPAPAPKRENKPAENTEAQPKKPATVDEYIAGAPAEFQDVLRNGLQSHNEEKAKLVEKILANKNNEFSKENLNSRPLSELRSIARLAAAAEASEDEEFTPNYSGQAPVARNKKGGGGEEDEILELPTMNFEKKEKAA